jgi:hypothetical protein
MKFTVNIPESNIYKHLTFRDELGADILADLVCAKNELERRKSEIPPKVDNDKIKTFLSGVSGGHLLPSRKIEYIKNIREAIPGLGLFEAKLLVEALQMNKSNCHYTLQDGGQPQGV